MYYISTRNNNLKKTFSEILFQGLSDDGGLFLPIVWPLVNINDLKGKHYQEIAQDVIYPFVKKDIDPNDLKKIVDNSFKNFNHNKIAPLINIEKNKYILELFYGPTFAFKDYAMQFLGSLFSYLLSSSNKKITIIGATSGDTGSAAIEAFKGKKNIEVFILHPHNRISSVQRKQMTTINDSNIYNIALKGNFDDCQKIVKNLFLDHDIQTKTSLTAVNSINWARIIAQSVYYFWTYSLIDNNKINFIVPSGNFGNIFSARVAFLMGLPINKLYLVTNSNDFLHRAITKGEMEIKNVINTPSPSMDIQVSSNFERQIFESSKRNSNEVKQIMNFFLKDGYYKFSQEIINDLRKIYESYSVTNSDTINIIKRFKDKYNYLADPHTATGLGLLEKKETDEPIVSLACAHPAKFADSIKNATGENPIMPRKLENIFDKNEKMTILENNHNLVKSHILDKIS